MMRGGRSLGRDSDQRLSPSVAHEDPNGAPGGHEKKSFFSRFIRGCRQNYQLTDWAYTIGIFLLVTFVLTFPLYLGGFKGVLFLAPAMAALGLFVALFTAYILTPFSLRHFRPFTEDRKILQDLEELARTAEIKTPRLLVADTPEMNALAFTSILGGRVCLTRGLLNAHSRGYLSDTELKAIIGHEIGHLKHGDCFKWSFVLSWLSIFDLIGTILLIMGTAFIATGAVTTVLSSRDNNGPLIALMGIGMIIAGVLQRLLGKIASIPAFHLSRRHEFAADLEGAKLTSFDAQISALQKIDMHNHNLESKKLAQLPFSNRWQTAPLNMSWIDHIFSTHPPIDLRVRELQQRFRSISASSTVLPLQAQYITAKADPMVRADEPIIPGAPMTDTGNETPLQSFLDTLLFPFRKSDPDMGEDKKGPKHKGLEKKVLVAVFISLGIVLAGILVVGPSIGPPAQSSATAQIEPGGALPFFPKETPTITPTIKPTAKLTAKLTVKPTAKPITPVRTTLLTTAPTQEKPVSLGQSAKVMVPHSETLELNYNTVYRQVSSSSILTIKYDVVAKQVTEIIEISSKSGDYTKKVTFNDPNAYLLITVRDPKSKEIISTSGFGKIYASTPKQKMIVRKTGDLEIEVTGARVTVDLALI